MTIQYLDRFNSGAFIRNAIVKDYLPFQNHYLYLTQEINNTLRSEIVKIIRDSKFVLKICTFILTDKEIFEEILYKANSSQVSIFLLTQLDQAKLKDKETLSNYITEEEINQNPIQVHFSYIKSLYENGVHVRASTSAHAKFIISDRSIGFITSANLTTPSLILNTESGVYLTEDDSKDLDKLFDIIFQKGTRYRQYIRANSKKSFVVQSEAVIAENHLLDITSSKLRYTYDDSTRNLYDEIINIINSASEYIYVSTYSIVGLEKLPQFITAIKNALVRGVNIFIFCRGMNYRNDHLSGSFLLKNLGCSIFADLYNHSKGIINENTAMIFTANIDGNHGLVNGFEVGYILNEVQRLEFLDFHKYLISISLYSFISMPTRMEFFETYMIYEMDRNINSPIFPKDLFIKVNFGVSTDIDELETLPIFFGKAKDESFLIVGKSLYLCKYEESCFTILEKQFPRFDLEKYILKYFTLTILIK